jgi:hypothetical protein
MHLASSAYFILRNIFYSNNFSSLSNVMPIIVTGLKPKQEYAEKFL